MDGLGPFLAAGDIALVFGNNEWNTVDEKNGVFAALLDALNPILIRGNEAV